MKLIFLITLATLPLAAFAQDATQSAVDLQPKTGEQATPEAEPSLSPSLPELSALDQAFKQTTLGKDADEMRTRVEMRKLQNEVVGEPAIVSAKAAVNAATTDLEKRERLRDYYNVYYDRIASKASSPEMKAAIAKAKTDHIAFLGQPRVRPGSGPTPPPKKKKEKKRHKGP
ncbi:MAG: hypothetical protein JWO45_1911 [Spartobacteria bacterium]|nr:hypothetical protein [Spartobacteria bacterium]